jgi:teichuronic acid biosynthesis glycosyltransferase TuaC
MKTIRVLVVSHMYPKNIDPTAGIFVHKQLTNFTEVDCQAKVISPVPYSPRVLQIRPKWKQYAQIPQSEEIEGISVYYPRYIRPPGQWFHSFSCHTMYRGISKISDPIIEEFKPHILHAYAVTPDGYAGLILKRRYNIPLVCSIEGSDIDVYPTFGRRTFKLTQRVIRESDQTTAVSKALKAVAESIATPTREIEVIYDGCDLESFAYNEADRQQIRKQLGISLNAKVILFTGHLLKDKGVFELVHAFIQLNSKHSDLHLVYVGEGPEYEALKEIIFSNGLDNKIHLVGRKLHSEIPGWMSAGDMLVLPSYHEGFPLVGIEALSCGKPVVATRVGGIPEGINEETGILVSEKDVSSLARGIGELIENKSKREKMGKRGREIVEEKFTWKKSAMKLRGIYERLIRQNPD